MKRYEEYKKTGLTWLPEIPQNWKWRFLSQVAQEQTIRKPAGEVYPILTLTYGEIKRKKNIDSGLVPADYGTYQMLYKGNIVLRLIDLQNDHTSLRTGIVKETGIITSAYTCIVPTENTTYLHYLLHSYDTKKVFYGYGGGVRQSIGFKDIRYLQVPVPPRAEQDQIVRFLDWKVSGINKLIAVKQKQIATLKEFMQAEIEKQLYAYPVVNTVRLKQLGTFFKGGGFSRDNLVEDEEYPAILYGDIYTQYEYKTSMITHHIDGEAYSASRKISKGDIVMAGTGETKDEIGKSILYMGDQIVAAGGDVIVFHPNEGINVEYLLYQLYSQAALKHRYINGKGDIIVHIFPTALGNTIITLPREANQNKVVSRINEIIDQVKRAIAVLTDEISVLREYRVRIVADTVTGKIDVRDVEIPEYEFAGEDTDAENEDDGEEETEEQED